MFVTEPWERGYLGEGPGFPEEEGWDSVYSVQVLWTPEVELIRGFDWIRLNSKSPLAEGTGVFNGETESEG